MSTKCCRLVVSSHQEACNKLLELPLKLRTYQIDKTGLVDKGMKWKISTEGTIESIKCPGVVIGIVSSTGSSVTSKLVTLVAMKPRH